MSFAHFDEIYEIILDLMEEEEVLVKEIPFNERLEPVKNLIPYNNDHRWWEEAVSEIINEKEKEKEGLYV